MNEKIILRIVGKNKSGGARKHCYQLNSALESKGISTQTFIPRPPFNDPLSSEELIELNYKNTLNVFRILSFALKNRTNIICIHSHLRNANVIGMILSKITFIPHICTVHGPLHTSRTRLKDLIFFKLLKYTFNKSAGVIYISKYVEQECKAKIKNSTGSVIYNGSEEISATLVPNKTLNVAVIGELTSRKNMDLLITLIKNLKHERSILFNVYGEGPYLEILKALSDTGHHIKPHGYEPNLNKIFTKCGLHLILSKNEGFGRVVTEAMSCGVPTVCFNSGAFPELLENGHTGFLCETETEIQNTLIQLSSNQKKLVQMSSHCKSTFYKKFSVEEFNKNTLDYIDNILGNLQK